MALYVHNKIGETGKALAVVFWGKGGSMSVVRLLYGIVISSTLITFSSCAGYQERFNEVEPGMEKHDVLEIMGNPKYTRRYQGVDRWGYIFYEEGRRFERQVHFREGVVTYRGNRPQPKISAEDQDRINAQENATIAAQETQRVQDDFVRRKQISEEYIEYSRGNRNDATVPQFRSIDNGQN
jgi:outer membrane protein assembly factor BamE (lipoprotein component of BamABCDE complex)